MAMAAATSDVPSLLTIIVCSSPVPSNPDTRTLRAIMASLTIVDGLSECPKIIHLDGPQAALPTQRVQAYAEFRERVLALSATDPTFSRSVVHTSRTFLFAAHNLAAAIKHVNTSFIFSLQHDYQIARPFDALGLLRTMLAVPVVKHVRLNMRPNAPAVGFDGVVANATLPGLLVPLTRTCGWSDAPHIASTAYYRKFVIPTNLRDHNGGRSKFMEESVHYPLQRNGQPGGCWETKQRKKRGEPRIVWPADFDDWGTYLYGVCSRTDGRYTIHKSLRGHQPQWGLEHNPIGDARGHGGKARGRGRGAVGSRGAGSGRRRARNLEREMSSHRGGS